MENSPSRRRAPALPSAVVVLLLLFAQAGSHAAPGDALSYARGYLGTINYAVGSVDLTEHANPPDQNGFSTGTISISGVPTDADIVAAYLYWETITLTANPSQASGVKFRGEDILLNDAIAVKQSSAPLSGSTASCWSAGVPLTMTHFRADVLHMLPIRFDKDNKPTGKRLVNSADLAAHGEPHHTVSLPVRLGNQVPESAGASLVVVYRDTTQPLRKIVLYDGIYTQPSLDTAMTQTLRGFYKSSNIKSAQITHIIASGQPNGNERIFFNDSNSPNATQISAADPVAGGNSSQRGWASLTYDVSPLMNPGANSSGGYGETATTRVDHAPGGGYDCLSWGAVIFSAAVADDDPNGGDGIPDGLEDSPGGLKDPDDTQLPNFHGMAASSAHRDLFIELNALWAPADTTYGSATAPYNATTPMVTDPTGHHHLPTPEDLKRVGDAYAAHGIAAHFDVGSIASYHGLGVVPHGDWVDDYTSTQADQYLVASDLARGGEVVQERACDPSNASCQFPDFPGTVGWKLGLQIYRDAPVGDAGQELNPDLTDPNNPAFNWETGTHRRRFDRERFGLFHYVLYAHARGTPRSQPCLIYGQPGPYDTNNGTSCTTPNPDFNPSQYHVPTSASGVADLPGGNALVTLGLWDEFVGKPFMRASTTFHEIGHNLNLWHGGLPAIWGNKAPLAPAQPTATYIEPNCKPNYQSSMSYLFQVHGLFDNADNIHLDYSSTAHNTLNDLAALALSDQTSLPPSPPYRWAWYAPMNSPLALNLGVSAATRYCSGAKFAPDANPLMARVYTTTTDAYPNGASIDWNGDLQNNDAGPQDVNLDGTPNNALFGFDDWASIRLDQISAGRRSVKFQAELLDGSGYGDLIDFGSGDYIDFGSGDYIDFGSGDYIDFGSGDYIDFGSGVLLDQQSGDYIDFGSGDLIDFGSGDDIDFGSGDLIDFGSGDLIDFGSGSERQEVDYDVARGLGRTVPYGLTACVIGDDQGCNLVPAVGPSTPQYHRVLLGWNASTVGHVLAYQVQRKRANAADNTYTTIGTSTTNSFVDSEELPNGLAFTYRVRAQFDDPAGVSGWSNPVTTKPVVNYAPAGVADSYQLLNNTVLTVVAPGVLGNDTDVDSPPAFTGRRVVLVSATSNGTLVLDTTTGSFTYTPKSGFVGTDSFTYRSNDGPWSADSSVPLSADSPLVTVTITVTKK